MKFVIWKLDTGLQAGMKVWRIRKDNKEKQHDGGQDIIKPGVRTRIQLITKPPTLHWTFLEPLKNISE